MKKANFKQKSQTKLEEFDSADFNFEKGL